MPEPERDPNVEHTHRSTLAGPVSKNQGGTQHILLARLLNARLPVIGLAVYPTSKLLCNINKHCPFSHAFPLYTGNHDK